MALAGKRFLVETEPTKAVVVDALTRDVDVKTCIFDLIDNSSDAARDTYFKRFPEKAGARPDSYGGFEINLTLSGDGLKIEDNCGGISVSDLGSMVLRFGKRSSHDMGIGVFGIGLNRALFKLGGVSSLRTDTGEQRAELVLDRAKYLAREDDWSLPAVQLPSSGNAGTEIEIVDPPEDIAREFADREWVDDLRHEIGRRYARYVAHGMNISVYGFAVENEEVPIRDGGPYEAETKFFRTEEGVAIYLRYGQHHDHRFSDEPDYNLATNIAIADDFGWTVLCNDRAIILSDKTDRTGWESRFHTEFNGFVGTVAFVGTNPALLPWNTTKTDVDLNNRAYRLALDDMRRFVDKWRRQAGQQRKRQGTPTPVPERTQPDTVGQPAPVTPSPKPGAASPAGSPKPAAAPKAATPKHVEKPDHDQFRTVLPADINERHCNDKHLKLVHEAKGLDLADLTYSGLALIRILFESSVVTYLERHGKFAELKQYAVDGRLARGMKMPPIQVKRLVPTFDDMIAFLHNNPELWGAAKENYLRHSLTRMAANQKLLNGVVHNVFQVVGAPTAFEIRNDVLPMLRHLIET